MIFPCEQPFAAITSTLWTILFMIFQAQLNSMETSICLKPKCNEGISTKFCTCHNSKSLFGPMSGTRIMANFIYNTFTMLLTQLESHQQNKPLTPSQLIHLHIYGQIGRQTGRLGSISQKQWTLKMAALRLVFWSPMPQSGLTPVHHKSRSNRCVNWNINMIQSVGVKLHN